MKKVAIVQSNYIPWKGYFDMIASVDEFILYDDMQFTRRDWRNRNQIKTPQGVQWLTIPVKAKGKYLQTIRETEIDGNAWQASHWKTLTLNYRKAQYFQEISALLEPAYLEYHHANLSPLNRHFIERICQYLGIATTITNCWDYPQVEGKSERLAALCEEAGATHYISGPAAKEYLDEDVFAAKGITVEWFEYSGYPEYAQSWGEFVHGVSIVDLLFHNGRHSTEFMRFAGRPLA